MGAPGSDLEVLRLAEELDAALNLEDARSR
jgi:hypothetical protein